jgi:hypothetical protein
MEHSTVTIPATTIDKLAALGKAMTALADDLRKHASPTIPQPLNIPIPDLTRPDSIPEGEAWFWSEEWLAKERAANEALKHGEYVSFGTVDDALRWLQEV